MVNNQPDADAISNRKPHTYVEEYRVRAQDIDLLNHVNNKAYLGWMENLAWQHSLSVGVDSQLHQKLQKLMIIKQHELNYHRPALLNDSLQLITWVSPPKGCCQRMRYYQFFRPQDNQLIFSAHTLWVCVNSKTHRPTPLPPEFNVPYFPE